MSDVTTLDEPEPLSLYIDLEPGQKPDIEAVARASLAFAAAIKEAAYIYDPSMAVRIELVSGTDGSLSLNSIIKALNPKDWTTKTRLIALATTALIWFRSETGRWLFDEVMSDIIGHHTELSSEDRTEIAKLVADALEKKVAQQQVQQVYRELETDRSVRGVGATREPGQRPDDIVPRSEFAERGGSATFESSEIIQQTRRSRQRVTVIRPVLETGRGAWQFSGSSGRFFAPVRDQRFLDDLLNGRTIIPMRAGIQLDIDLDTVEENRDGVWVPLRRTVIAVRHVYPAPTQESLPLPPPR